jgi:hypothetical protein
VIKRPLKNRKKWEKFMFRTIATLLMATVAVVCMGAGVERTTHSAPAMADKVIGAGTPGRIAKWLASDTIGDSVITEDSNGLLGINNAPNPNTRLFVFSNAAATNSSAIMGNHSGTGRGIEGHSVGGIGVNGVGVVGVNGITFSSDPNDSAVRGISQSGIPYAGDFSGNVRITGMLTKGGGSFRIDHPLDPYNKYLSHSFVESPDMMNIYNGNIVTNDSGLATVRLPDYFEALNRDFRYQLTVVGQFAQAIVAEKIKSNVFTIKTDKPRVEVSWQVTGVRKDKFAEENRIKVESEKPAGERGTLQNP